MSLVTCNDPKCRRWATTYTTRQTNPKPWPEVSPDPWGLLGAVEPLWYACPRHATSKHLPLEGDPPVCEHCGVSEGVSWCGGMTNYHHRPSVWERLAYVPHDVPDPNRRHPYCKDCGDEYYSFYREMWADYRASQF